MQWVSLKFPSQKVTWYSLSDACPVISVVKSCYLNTYSRPTDFLDFLHEVWRLEPLLKWPGSPEIRLRSISVHCYLLFLSPHDIPCRVRSHERSLRVSPLCPIIALRYHGKFLLFVVRNGVNSNFQHPCAIGFVWGKEKLKFWASSGFLHASTRTNSCGCDLMQWFIDCRAVLECGLSVITRPIKLTNNI